MQVVADFHEEMTTRGRMGASQFNKGLLAVQFHEGISIIVPQGCDVLKFRILDKDLRTVLAQGQLPVRNILDLHNDNGDITINMTRKGRGKKILGEDPKCMITVYYDDLKVEKS